MEFWSAAWKDFIFLSGKKTCKMLTTAQFNRNQNTCVRSDRMLSLFFFV